MQTHSELYKRDSKGAVRVWFIEQEAERYRYVTGICGGTLTRSGWTVAVPKSKPTAQLQADFEVQSAYTHQLEREYHLVIADIDTPRFFKPMLAKKYEGWPGDCYSQPKLDGIRCIASAKGLFSREGKPITAVPHIEAALAPLFDADPDLILDGELYNHDLREDFNQISSIVRKQKPTEADLIKAAEVIQYHIYDVPSQGFLPFGDRLKAFPQIGGCIRYVPTQLVNKQWHLDEIYGQYLSDGYEGQMVRLDKPYEQKRSSTLLKRKEWQDEEFPIVRFEEGIGNWSGMAKAVVCRLPDGREFGSGIKGDQAFAKSLLTSGYNQATIKFFNFTPDGIPRFGVAIKFHEVAA